MSEAWKSDPGMSSIQIMEKETHTEGGGRKQNRMFKNARMFKIASFIQQKKAFTRTEGKEFSAGITEVRSYKWYFVLRNRNLYLLWKTWTFLLSCLTHRGLVTAVFMCIIIAKWKRRKQWTALVYKEHSGWFPLRKRNKTASVPAPLYSLQEWAEDTKSPDPGRLRQIFPVHKAYKTWDLATKDTNEHLKGRLTLPSA